MDDKLIFIPNDDTKNYPFCRIQLKRLDTQLNKPTNLSPKVVKQTKKKTLL